MVVFYNMTENEVKSYSNFHLSMEVNGNELSLLLVNIENSKPEAIEHLSLETTSIKELKSTSKILSLASPLTVSCVILNSSFTLLPKALYNASNKEEYLNQVVNLNQDDVVKDDYFVNDEVVACFALNKELNSDLLSVFPTLVTKHISSVLCDSAKEGININFSSETSYEIAVKKDKKLLYFNRFSFENEDESFYFLTLIAEKNKLDLIQEKLYVSGKVFADSKTLSFWKQFIPEENITFNDIEASQINAVSRHQFFTLHKQHSCVL